jgi:hypothetical protein
MPESAFFKEQGEGLLQRKRSCFHTKVKKGQQMIPTSVLSIILEVHKHRVHIGLLLHILQCCCQTRGQREKVKCSANSI